jgi:hypothetical protein
MKDYIKYMLSWTDDKGIMLSQAPKKDNPNKWITWRLGGPGQAAPRMIWFTLFSCGGAPILLQELQSSRKEEDENY